MLLKSISNSVLFFIFSRMSAEEQQKYRMDSCLGGTSETVHKKAIQRYITRWVSLGYSVKCGIGH